MSNQDETTEEFADIIEQRAVDITSKTSDFKAILDDISSVTDKKKQLWREIYENAICDRHNANAMFVMLVKIASNKSTEHAVHGRSIATYIEKMSRANDQLLKLADLIAAAERKTNEISEEDIYSQIQKPKAV